MMSRFTVHSSTLFSTTRTSFRKNGTLLFCRPSYSGLRHFLDDFGECRFSRLLLNFLFTHSPDDFTSPGASTGQFGSYILSRRGHITIRCVEAPHGVRTPIFRNLSNCEQSRIGHSCNLSVDVKERCSSGGISPFVALKHHTECGHLYSET